MGDHRQEGTNLEARCSRNKRHYSTECPEKKIPCLLETLGFVSCFLFTDPKSVQ